MELEELYSKSSYLDLVILLSQRLRGLSTLTSMNDLAGLLDSQGMYDEANPMYQETLALREKVLGKGHSITLTNMNNLASQLESLSKYDESEQLLVARPISLCKPTPSEC